VANLLGVNLGRNTLSFTRWPLALLLHWQGPCPQSPPLGGTPTEELAKWWGPRGFTAPSVEFDPHVGGSYRIAMQPPDGDLFYLSGKFLEVDPPARLAYTFRWDPPDPDDRETVVTLSLEDRGEETEVLFTQAEFATEDAARYTKEAGPTVSGGWSGCSARHRINQGCRQEPSNPM
jgi:uncharacterized protein YndB with AHSA1/START domain